MKSFKFKSVVVNRCLFQYVWSFFSVWCFSVNVCNCHVCFYQYKLIIIIIIIWHDAVNAAVVVLQTYSKKAVELVQEALTQAQKTHVLSQNIFEVVCALMSSCSRTYWVNYEYIPSVFTPTNYLQLNVNLIEVTKCLAVSLQYFVWTS